MAIYYQPSSSGVLVATACRQQLVTFGLGRARTVVATRMGLMLRVAVDMLLVNGPAPRLVGQTDSWALATYSGLLNV